MTKLQRKQFTGFTIVETMIIIVVLGILVSFVVISIGNWRQRTTESAIRSDLANARTAMENARNFNSTGYPTGALPSSFTESKNIDVTLDASSDADHYCIEGRSTTDSTMVFSIRSADNEVVAGDCP